MGTTSFEYEDETVLITGASSGIGRALALAFADSGATVLNADLRAEPKDEDVDLPIHERIRRRGGTAAFVEIDVSEPTDIEGAVERARSFGGVDVFVNNAGIHLTASILDVSEAQFDDIHDVNVKGCFFGCQAAARDMIDRGASGSILNMASISSTMAKPGQIAYESTKGAIQMITRSAAVELADHGVRVNAIAPGRIATSFGQTSAEETAASVLEGDLIKPIPLNRAGVPADVTGAALFLASDEAEYVTGETIYVDGGYQAI